MDDLEERLQDQIAFLDASCEAYDRGTTREAYRLATTIRVLVHDTPRSHSLLAQMQVKETISYIDGRSFHMDHLPPLGGGAMSSAPGLAVIAHFYQREGSTRDASAYWPAFREDANSKLPSKPRVAFDEWWKTPVSTDTLGHRLFRRHFILAAANKDGGAHIDRMFGQEFEGYRAMTREDSMGKSTGGSFVVSGGPTETRGGGLSPALSVIRHIAEEIRVGLRLQLAGALGDLAQAPLDVAMERPFMFTGDSQWSLPPGYWIETGPQPA